MHVVYLQLEQRSYKSQSLIRLGFFYSILQDMQYDQEAKKPINPNIYYYAKINYVIVWPLARVIRWPLVT